MPAANFMVNVGTAKVGISPVLPGSPYTNKRKGDIMFIVVIDFGAGGVALVMESENEALSTYALATLIYPSARISLYEAIRIA